ncbi:hypothetical protein HLH17_14570 [Acinetobacter sp. ANC 5380]|uniref:Uncharacterized protein n=1 Tax=Acinetobacter terrae TaxID=2731247 RepID=A0A7Y2WBZ5_9GAMM|nr:hypothetical protein [Acinetobacter terrae]NNH78845.1 hypothetical protein [Acinetobacter terrae]
MIHDNSEKIDESERLHFITTRDSNTGRIGKSLTEAMPYSEIRQPLCKMYKLVKQEDIGKESFQFPVQEFVSALMVAVRAEINNSSKELYLRLVNCEYLGVLTEYSQEFERLMDGKLQKNTPMESTLTRVFASQLEDFEKIDHVKRYVPNGQSANWHYISNVQEVYKEFQKLTNLLVMYMSIQYKALDNKDYYDSGNIIGMAINRIKTYLNKNFDNKIANDIEWSLYVNNFDIFKEYCAVRNKVFTEENIHQMVKQSLSVNQYSRFEVYEYDRNKKEYSTRFTTEYHDHFAQVLKMLRFVNMIETVHHKLLATKKNPNEVTIELYMLNGRPV